MLRAVVHAVSAYYAREHAGRGALIGLLLLGTLAPSLCRAAENGSQQPERAALVAPCDAYVLTKVALARSGPGREHYATDPLTRGEKVRVLRVEDGWIAIQTPAESFSWIPGEHLRMLPDGKSAEVIGDDVPAWVGSQLGEVKQHEYQVKLRRGEQVEVLGKKEIAGDNSAVWVKIKPPAGEYRWLPVGNVTTRPSPREKSAGSTGGATKGAAKETEADENAGWIDRSSSPRRSRRSVDAMAETPLASKRNDKPSAKLSEELTSLLDMPADASFEDMHVRLQLALSRLVARGPTLQELELLEQRARELTRRGRTSLERGQAALLVESIEEFQTLAQRRAGRVARTSFNSAAQDGQSADERSETASGGLYEAEGWLMPVSSPRQTAPPFVIMDREGHPVAFVTPAPGVNLRRYIDKQVGIIGQSSFKVFDQPHVVAHRAVKLSNDDQPIARLGSAAPWIKLK